ncbi:MAG: DUF3168 domain-containing protein [Alphaproteobacteria bacterium]|nr:DUF3168 domain-containing protein [Alphaproteobacteria bacterium]
MSLPLYQLQQALFARLNGDALLMSMIQGIHDSVPQNTSFPYVVIGDGDQNDVPASDTISVRCSLDIEVFSRSKGRKEVLLILERLYALLHQSVLTVSGYECIISRCSRAETETLIDAVTLRGSMRVTILLMQEIV